MYQNLLEIIYDKSNQYRELTRHGNGAIITDKEISDIYDKAGIFGKAWVWREAYTSLTKTMIVVSPSRQMKYVLEDVQEPT